jgi:hypothetical protein
LVVLIVTGFTGAALAARFSDSASSPFTTEIDNIAQAGCASGFPDGTYRPTQPVNRQQMAAFINRCGGRIAHTTGSTVTTSSSGAFQDIAEVTITPGGLAGPSPCADATCLGPTTNVVRFRASAHAATTDEGDCPCDLELRIVTDIPSPLFNCTLPTRAGDLLGSGGDDGRARAASSVGGACLAPAGEPVHAKLQARYTDGNVASVSFVGEITATSAPFGPTGGGTL